MANSYKNYYVLKEPFTNLTLRTLSDEVIVSVWIDDMQAGTLTFDKKHLKDGLLNMFTRFPTADDDEDNSQTVISTDNTEIELAWDAKYRELLNEIIISTDGHVTTLAALVADAKLTGKKVIGGDIGEEEDEEQDRRAEAYDDSEDEEEDNDDEE